jgi:hypothetical protein
MVDQHPSLGEPLDAHRRLLPIEVAGRGAVRAPPEVHDLPRLFDVDLDRCLRHRTAGSAIEDRARTMEAWMSWGCAARY